MKLTALCLQTFQQQKTTNNLKTQGNANHKTKQSPTTVCAFSMFLVLVHVSQHLLVSLRPNIRGILASSMKLHLKQFLFAGGRCDPPNFFGVVITKQ